MTPSVHIGSTSPKDALPGPALDTVEWRRPLALREHRHAVALIGFGRDPNSGHRVCAGDQRLDPPTPSIPTFANAVSRTFPTARSPSRSAFLSAEPGTYVPLNRQGTRFTVHRQPVRQSGIRSPEEGREIQRWDVPTAGK